MNRCSSKYRSINQSINLFIYLSRPFAPPVSSFNLGLPFPLCLMSSLLLPFSLPGVSWAPTLLLLLSMAFPTSSRVAVCGYALPSSAVCCILHSQLLFFKIFADTIHPLPARPTSLSSSSYFHVGCSTNDVVLVSP